MIAQLIRQSSSTAAMHTPILRKSSTSFQAQVAHFRLSPERNLMTPDQILRDKLRKIEALFCWRGNARREGCRGRGCRKRWPRLSESLLALRDR
jgi:hypothetical protein